MKDEQRLKLAVREVALRRRLLIAVLAGSGLAGCMPLVVGGSAVTAAMVATDRRTAGMQVEDERIERVVAARVYEQMPQAGRIQATSFNRIVLLTGEVRTIQDKQKAGQLVANVENVRTVVNELTVVEFVSSLGQRSKDTLLTSQVKASLLNARDLQANTIKVITELNVVYLMGLLTARESTRAAEIARGVNDVRKVVRVVETITEEELAGYQPSPAAPVTHDAAVSD